MNDKEMYGIVCRDRFDKIDEQLVNHIPHKINNMFWKFLGVLLPLFGTLIYFVLRN